MASTKRKDSKGYALKGDILIPIQTDEVKDIQFMRSRWLS